MGEGGWGEVCGTVGVGKRGRWNIRTIKTPHLPLISTLTPPCPDPIPNRQLVELGYRGSGDTLKREEFEARKRALRERSSQKTNVPKQLSSMGKDISDSPLLQALQAREELVRNGKLTTSIFIRDRNAKGQEVSGYIDYALRLKTENFEPYFEKRKKIMPKPSDLSYFNWETQTSTSNSTPNFQVIADNETGL